MTILLLFLTFTFAAELQVEGDLKVTGNIDVQNNPIKNVGIPQELTDAINGNVLQDALRDDAIYEYMFISAVFFNALYENNSAQFYSQYKEMNQSGYQDNFENKLNNLILEGWKVSSRLGNVSASNSSSDLMIVYELKRPIEE